MITEKEPWRTGDYAGFYKLLEAGDPFCQEQNILFAFYGGHPSPEGWLKVVKHCEMIYLSRYIDMATWNRVDKGFSYVKGRYDRIAVACETLQKTIPVNEIISLERKIWGSNNDFMGQYFTEHSFYGSAYQAIQASYNTYSSQKVKDYTDLVGMAIFEAELGLKARPASPKIY